MRVRFGSGPSACLGLALALHGAVFAALYRADTRTWQADTPPRALQVRMVAAAALPGESSPPEEPMTETALQSAARPVAATAKPDTATDEPGSAQPLDSIQINLPDVPLDSTKLELHAWLQLDEQGGVQGLDVSDQPETLAPFVLAARDGLSHARFETASRRSTLCVSIVFADQQPVQVQSLGLSSPERCLRALSAATR